MTKGGNAPPQSVYLFTYPQLVCLPITYGLICFCCGGHQQQQQLRNRGVCALQFTMYTHFARFCWAGNGDENEGDSVWRERGGQRHTEREVRRLRVSQSHTINFGYAATLGVVVFCIINDGGLRKVGYDVGKGRIWGVALGRGLS